MSIYVGSLALDALVLSTEKPEPVPLPTNGGIPINPLAFPADWSQQITLESRWQTDVTRPNQTNLPEKLILASRPVRNQTIRLVGASKEETHALLQGAAAHTAQLGVPIPIYCDEAVIQGVGNSTIMGDFRYRRFFVGGRVAISPRRVVPHRGANSTIYARITALTATEMTLDWDPAPIRSPEPIVDSVYPCMDVELVPSASGSSPNSDVFELQLSWDEVEGVSSLPGLWPSADQIHGENMAAICTIVDGLPVFPFDFNWGEGVTVEALRRVDSSPSGRATIQDPQGESYFRFEVSLMGWNRARTWSILRFFDAMRGRAGTFYFHHPHRPWKLVDVPSTTTVRIQPVGDPWQLKTFFSKVALFRADGSFITRKVTEAVDSTPYHQLTLDSALPDTLFTSIQPIFEASFEEDRITETWSNIETIPSMTFSIITEPRRGGVGVSQSIGYQPQPADFISIPGCNLLLRAGSGCISSTNRPSTMWPGPDSTVSKWRDVSFGPTRSDDVPPTRHVASFESLSKPPDLIQFPVNWQNNGQPAIRDPNFSLITMLDTSIPIANRHLWGPTGWTLFLCFTPEELGPSAVSRDILRVNWDTGQEFRLFADRSGLTGPLRAGLRRVVNPPAASIALLTVDIAKPKFAIFITLHWNGPVLRVWVNGKKALASAVSSAMALSLSPLPATYNDCTFFDGWYHNIQVTSSSLKETFGREAAANLVASYNRPLTIDEINQVHVSIANLYGAFREESTLYS